MRRGVELGFALASKAILATLVVASFAATEYLDYSQRGVNGRAAASLLALAAVPMWWLRRGRLGRRGYPFAIDALLPVPLIIDYLARAFDVASYAWWDAAIHAINWALLALVVSLVLIRLDLTDGVSAVLCIGTGAAWAIVWELLEYAILHPERSSDQYVNTMQDLAVALGATVVVAMVVLGLRRVRR